MMSDAVENFYQMVKEWTVSDYWTPGIKAEVILDMLLSDFVADIVGQKLNQDLILLAKEFPIPAGGKEDSLSNAKVDYVLACPGTNGLPGVLYLTELKTYPKSYKEKQLERMCLAKERGTEKLFQFYQAVQSSYKDRIQKAKKERHMQTLLARSGVRDEKDVGKLSEMYGSIEIVYLSLTELNIPHVTVCQPLVDGYLPADQEKRAKWDLTRQVLQECISGLSNMQGR